MNNNSSPINYPYDKQCKMITEFVKDNYFKFLIIFSAICIYIAIAEPLQNSLLSSKEFTDRLTLIKTIIEDSTLLNTWLLFCVMAAIVSLCLKTLYKKSLSFSISVLLLSVLSLLILWYRNEWNYAEIFNIDYRYILTFGIIILICISVYRLFKWTKYVLKGEIETDDLVKSFSNDLPKGNYLAREACSLSKILFWIISHMPQKNRVNNPKVALLTESTDETTSQTRKDIAKEIVSRLNATIVNHESFAICITGAWGAGKTSFLNYLKDEIIASNKAYGLEDNIIEFHPWNSNSSAQIIDDFFGLLSKYLISRIPGLEDDLAIYIKLLVKFDAYTDKLASPIIELLSKNRKTEIENARKRIADQLSILNHKVFIIIDDIDRLDTNEILSVLRLIRNSANFPNLVFIAALDKQYTCEHLEEARFKDGKSFLEKIFQVEFALPRIDHKDMIDMLRFEIRSNLPLPSKKAEGVLTEISNSEEKRRLLNNVFTNFRIAKRLVRQFSVSANYLKNKLNENEYELGDLFYLEMLHYIDPQLYEQISNHPTDYFEEAFNVDSGAYWYLEDGFENNMKTNSQFSTDIMRFLFSKKRSMNRGRLALKSNYNNYFCLSQPRETVKYEDFQIMISSGKGNDFTQIENQVKEWCRSAEKSKESMDSIYHGFRVSFYRGKKYTIAEIKPYIIFVIFWAFYEKNYNICLVEAVTNVLNGRVYVNELDKEAAKLFFEEKLKKLIQRKDANILHLVWVLGKLFRFDTVYKKYIVENDFYKQLISNDCFNVLIENKELEASSLVQEGTPLYEFASNAVVENKTTGIKQSLVIDKIINYLSNKENKSKYVFKVEEFFPAVTKGTNTQTPQYEEELSKLKCIFGSEKTIELFSTYFQQCFDRTKAVRKGVNQLKK